ncbi:hypothetical protein [Glutamicibacter sp. V16R2B1]|uniref:hypothetical protein n=1 Tax=Glutamicibacter sp. V16R2B1 TaxID=2036207 RepID=UPI0010FF1817|nr:hypothetical protein [Glutamicibacter sp. V16R2B1]MCK9901237.1 hypothetical protein [Frankia sp. Cpl3]TLK46885.1 hypothetical protein FDN03_16055 [Glutamicibacter sp. V16R2B1]
MADTATRADTLLDEVTRLRRQLADAQAEAVRWERVAFDAAIEIGTLHALLDETDHLRIEPETARRTASHERAERREEIEWLRAELDARRCPLAGVRATLGRAAGAAGILAGALAVVASVGRGATS